MARKVWRVTCSPCKKLQDLEAGNFTIVNRRGEEDFIRKPQFICAKCGNDCKVELVKI